MENIGLGAGLAALAFWGFVAAVAVASYWDTIRKREAQHETVRRLVESGQPIDQELMDKLLLLSDGGSQRHDRDFQLTGMWLLPVAVGMAVFALILGSQHTQALGALLGVAGLLACMGIGCLLAARVARRWYPVDGDSAE
jgi:hypothetical protein|tara:strand:+ start:1336 stop:1755 length:420 start_codon:yes stop_codon:yes gene_type:complete